LRRKVARVAAACAIFDQITSLIDIPRHVFLNLNIYLHLVILAATCVTQLLDRLLQPFADREKVVHGLAYVSVRPTAPMGRRPFLVFWHAWDAWDFKLWRDKLVVPISMTTEHTPPPTGRELDRRTHINLLRRGRAMLQMQFNKALLGRTLLGWLL
jgi:hypothetical protein